MLLMVNKITKFTDIKISVVSGKHMMYNAFNVFFSLLDSTYFIDLLLGTGWNDEMMSKAEQTGEIATSHEGVWFDFMYLEFFSCSEVFLEQVPHGNLNEVFCSWLTINRSTTYTDTQSQAQPRCCWICTWHNQFNLLTKWSLKVVKLVSFPLHKAFPVRHGSTKIFIRFCSTEGKSGAIQKLFIKSPSPILQGFGRNTDLRVQQMNSHLACVWQVDICWCTLLPVCSLKDACVSREKRPS